MNSPSVCPGRWHQAGPLRSKAKRQVLAMDLDRYYNPPSEHSVARVYTGGRLFGPVCPTFTPERSRLPY